MDESRTICFCNNVPLNELLRVIREGAHTLEQIKEITKASTGCGGCENEVIDILAEELKKIEAAKQGQTPEK